jgi:putative flippase GtrA
MKEIETFSKATVAAIGATVVDFGTLTIWVEVLHQFYPIGVALGAAFGAVTNFLLNRHWAFDAARVPVGIQALKYAVVSAGSLLLNTGGVYLVTEKLHLFYLFSKIGVALVVALLFNYPLQRFFVYRKPMPVGL